jgi:hypothetical protein
MKPIIEIIYDYILENNEGYFKNCLITDEESNAYDEIRNSLTEKQKEAFDKFEELYAERHCESEQETYFAGFRMGARMAFEIMDMDIPNK